jgi:histidine ammonia-lyase
VFINYIFARKKSEVIKISRKEALSLKDIEQIVSGQKVEIEQETMQYNQQVHDFLLNYSKDKVIYGINTGLGPMAQYKVEDGKQIDLQLNLIRSHAAGCGVKLDDNFVKAAMVSRIKSVAQGVSGIHPSCIELLKEFINRDIFPYIPQHGSVGASGDLVQLSHIALTLIGEGTVTHNGVEVPTEKILKQYNLKPIEVVLREGLSLINGTSVMTGISLVNLINAWRLYDWELTASALLNEIVESFDDHFSLELNQVKKHHGQLAVAAGLREILDDSKMIRHRADYFYHNEIKETVFKKKVQEYYSLRCLPQILGPVYDTIKGAEAIVVDELNSVSDNPVIDFENQIVHHGGNFHGDYVSLEMDKLKLAITRLTMLSERHINYLFNPRLNEILPPFVNLGVLGLNLGMQGMQFTATSTTAENQTLSNSMYVHSIPTNNDNQDIVSMGTNSALQTARVIDNAFQVLSIELIALAQAVDYLQILSKLSTRTQCLYKTVRELVPVFKDDAPRYGEINKVYQMIKEFDCISR